MPEEVEAKQTMGRLETGDDSKSSDPDSLQRALEIEVVAQLREQNARLLEEPETYRQLKHTAKSGDGSSQSWVEIRDMQSGDGIDGQGCKTPRNTVTVGNTVRYTPNGTQVPTGTPPTDERPEPPAHVSVPPVPPFPTGVPEDATKFLMGMNLFIKLQRCGLWISSGNLVVRVQRNQHQVKLGHCGWKEKFKLCGIP